MYRFLKHWLSAFLLPKPLLGILYLPQYFKDIFVFKKADSHNLVKWIDTHPCLTDRSKTTPFDAHYFYQGAWLARKLSDLRPKCHVDVGSSVMMLSVLSAAVKTVYVDFRPLQVSIPGIVSVGANITNLPFMDNSISSLSSLHSIEHIGLGRYGDLIDPNGSKDSAQELERVLMVGGLLYLSLPVGRERVCFNAHRVFAPQSVINFFTSMKLIEFSCVSDSGQYKINEDIHTARLNEYACGMYVFEKIK